MHRNMFHASDPAIRPYMAENRGFCRFWGVRDFAVFYSLYISYRPCLGSLGGVMFVDTAVCIVFVSCMYVLDGCQAPANIPQTVSAVGVLAVYLLY